MRDRATRLHQLRLRVERSLGTLGRFAVRFGLDPLAAPLARPLLVAEELRPEPFIVVLSGGIRSTGRLNEVTRARIAHGVRLFHRGLAPILILSGGRRAPHRPNSAPYMRALCESLGVPPSSILTEGTSSRTAENAREVARLVRARGESSILLVTSPAHMRRAKLCFERQAIRVSPAAAFPPSPTASPGKASLLEEVLHEYLALLCYRALGWV
jgi:uncharacterized SAM-binding protein YcdF (DUF218 family)